MAEKTCRPCCTLGWCTTCVSYSYSPPVSRQPVAPSQALRGGLAIAKGGAETRRQAAPFRSHWRHIDMIWGPPDGVAWPSLPHAALCIGPQVCCPTPPPSTWAGPAFTNCPSPAPTPPSRTPSPPTTTRAPRPPSQSCPPACPRRPNGPSAAGYSPSPPPRRRPSCGPLSCSPLGPYPPPGPSPRRMCRRPWQTWWACRRRRCASWRPRDWP